ncbi:hypothetical protein P171DRAFT_207482 [Karstenula rhodostoma CBS 690.94]|uniref:Extracellular membrane protein CFEM domain-containing protein n=1 Tax=Karstenula rhodostoma CBS 690.94 TaxID=1392251 RepID=A0A9P4PQ79_9PLEO|nr:hypothetical protein P171DRAFT_207482 [Karstenula rhodostoma CBS 690.94]
MRPTTLHLVLATLALAAAAPHAHPQDAPTSTLADPTIALPPSTSLNVPTTLLPTLSVPGNLSTTNPSKSTRHHFSHWEPIPIFSSACNCPSLATVQYPCWATDTLQRCNFEELHSFVCWTSAARGCPTPTRQCDKLYAPTPITGKHPCDLGQNTGGLEPAPTTVYITETSYATFVPTAAAAVKRGAATAAPLGRWQDMAWSPEHYGVRK